MPAPRPGSCSQPLASAHTAVGDNATRQDLFAIRCIPCQNHAPVAMLQTALPCRGCRRLIRVLQAAKQDAACRQAQGLGTRNQCDCRNARHAVEECKGLTRVLEAVEEGAVQLRIQRAVARERGWQLLGVPRHHHTLRPPHLRIRALMLRLHLCRHLNSCKPSLATTLHTIMADLRPLGRRCS